MDTDVLVVGAGLSGLAAADALAAVGRDVVVWEARDRVGGRMLTEDVDGAAVDLGAQWLGPTQWRMHELVQRFGLATFPTHTDGRSVLVDGCKRRTYRGTVPLLGPLQLGRMALGLTTFRRLARTADRAGTHDGVGSAPIAPVTTTDSRADRAGTHDEVGSAPIAPVTTTDSHTLASVLDGPLGDGSARAVVDAAIRVIFGADPGELSADWVAAYAAAAGGDLLDLAAVDGGAQQTRLVGGTQAIASGLAEGLDIRLGREVVEIQHTDDGVTVHARSGETIRAAHLVVSVPTPLVDTIAFDPPLPSSRLAVQRRMPMGATAKVVAVYDDPFWRADGLTGEAVLTDGPVQVIFDNTSADGSVPALLAFVTGSPAHAAARGTEDSLHDAVVAAMVRAFGPRAAHPTRVVSKQWVHERFTGGCPVANLAPGAAMHASALTRPVGRIRWAGTETATEWTGYMEGAVVAGRRAAQDIVAGR